MPSRRATPGCPRDQRRDPLVRAGTDMWTSERSGTRRSLLATNGICRPQSPRRSHGSRPPRRVISNRTAATLARTSPDIEAGKLRPGSYGRSRDGGAASRPGRLRRVRRPGRSADGCAAAREAWAPAQPAVVRRIRPASTTGAAETYEPWPSAVDGHEFVGLGGGGGGGGGGGVSSARGSRPQGPRPSLAPPSARSAGSPSQP